MSNPDNAEAQEATNKVQASTESTFEEQVNGVVGQLVQDDEGNWHLPDDVQAKDEVLFAAKLEKRRRDTESAFGKARHQLKVLEETTKEYEKRLAAQVQIELSPEDADRLEQLKIEDPEAWRKEMNHREAEATKTLQEELQGTKKTTSQQAELERRKEVLNQFNKDHSDAPITDDALANDIPPRIVKRLEEGKITFEEFLQESYEFMTDGKSIKKDETSETPNLGKAGGGDTPDPVSAAIQDANDYSKVVF